MTFQLKPNRGSLFKDESKSKPEDRDYSGAINVEGEEYWLSGWVSTSRAGKKYLSLSIKPKQEPPPDTSKPLSEEMQDEIPF